MTRRTLGSVILWTAIVGVLCALFITRERWAYEPYSAEDYGGVYAVTLEKRWTWFPAPRFVERTIDQERFEELARSARGSEISCGEMQFYPDDGTTAEPFPWSGRALQIQYFLSESCVADSRAVVGAP